MGPYPTFDNNSGVRCSRWFQKCGLDPANSGSPCKPGNSLYKKLGPTSPEYPKNWASFVDPPSPGRTAELERLTRI